MADIYLISHQYVEYLKNKYRTYHAPDICKIDCFLTSGMVYHSIFGQGKEDEGSQTLMVQAVIASPTGAFSGDHKQTYR